MKCGDCGADMVKRNSKYGIFFGCSKYPACKGTHSAHQKSGAPQGKPTNAEGRAARRKAHEVFDGYWPGTNMNRQQAYLWLALQMVMTGHECHIGNFDEQECARVIEIVEEAKNNPAE